MNRYITIDHYTGFVWGEAYADDPITACRLIDEALGESGREYEDIGFVPLNGRSGYHVYVAPAHFPTIADGQADATVAAVEALPIAAYVAIVSEFPGAVDDPSSTNIVKELTEGERVRYGLSDPVVMLALWPEAGRTILAYVRDGREMTIADEPSEPERQRLLIQEARENALGYIGGLLEVARDRDAEAASVRYPDTAEDRP